MMDDLEALRAALDAIDARLIEDLAERETLIGGVANYKIKQARDLRIWRRKAVWSLMAVLIK